LAESRVGYDSDVCGRLSSGDRFLQLLFSLGEAADVDQCLTEFRKQGKSHRVELGQQP
jgi:hypothetical protein